MPTMVAGSHVPLLPTPGPPDGSCPFPRIEEVEDFLAGLVSGPALRRGRAAQARAALPGYCHGPAVRRGRVRCATWCVSVP
ncbi:hypothetical protein J7I94_30040 [Streptomyces sp. ISL-12]|uniref:hypothetical protein n=1 Tax=Streptomyces sp. ISL-12 TaxID=2819177 RepID=UPI001BE63AC5|nr:hypothetical protein [Streptomyces sp. ISL-12]MBT2414740.1 hypothetical protein [Streptomyces sp. ISL-12]